MLAVQISDEIHANVPDFQIGILAYYDIVVAEFPQMLSGRYNYLQEERSISVQEKGVAAFEGIAEWRNIFKKLGMDPSRYRPSSEALYRRLKKGDKLPDIHSAADLNNYWSIKYEIPLGIYDLDNIDGPVEIRIGTKQDAFEGLNGRPMNMEGKLLSADTRGAFGSPIVDSKRTMTTKNTRNALQLVYFRPSTQKEDAETMLAEMCDGFIHIHGGSGETKLIAN
ncbi:MAG TPA: phenylalanine--tRNA ligase beta subunit-related protein [Bacillales bacterium]|nr:phenylalanine--tRNA ligase beta subunit-related protein [Bacillales bacterium]